MTDAARRAREVLAERERDIRFSEPLRLLAELADENSRLAAQLTAMRASLHEARCWTDDDLPLPEDDAIHDAYSTRSGDHSTYAEASRLVGAKRSKGALVSLVNWLLVRLATKDALIAELAKALDRSRIALETLACVVAVVDGPIPTREELRLAWEHATAEHDAAADVLVKVRP